MTKSFMQKLRQRNMVAGKPMMKPVSSKRPLRVTYNPKVGGSFTRTLAPVRGINRIDMPPVGVMSAAPVALSRNVKSGRPNQVYLKNGDCFITHREYIQDIVATTGTPSAFNVTGFAINPGQVAVFPWLAGVASRFESYCFESLRFEYETEAPSTLGGSVILTVDYDASDPAPATKQVAMSYADAVRSAPWEPSEHTSKFESLSKQKTYFVRPAAVPAGADIKTYDTGNLFVVTQGVTTASATCGELYVTYRVKLMTPLFDQTNTSSGSIKGLGSAGAPWFGSTPTAVGGIGIVSSASFVTVSGLIVGQEYSLAEYITGTVITEVAYTSTSITTVTSAGVVNGAATAGILFQTFIALATTVILTIQSSYATQTAHDLVVSQMSAAAGF